MESKNVRLTLLKVGLVLAAGIGVGLAFWYPLRRAQKAHIQRISRFAVQSLKTDIEDEIRSQLLGQIQVAQLYGLEGNFSKQVWNSYASIFEAHHPGYLAFLLIDNDFRIRFALSQPAAQPYLDTLFAAGGPLVQVLRSAASRQKVMLSPAVFLQNGQTGHAVLAPIFHGGEPQGFVIAVLDDRQFLADALADQEGLGYGFAVSEDQQELYRSAGGDSEGEVRWGQDAEIALGATIWHLHVWPQTTLLGEIEPRLPKLAFATGSAIGMLVATTFIFAWAAYVRSQQLSYARDTLEHRVQERTSELKLLNTALENEVSERRQAEQSLQELSGRLLRLRDEEQRRIARELHDSTVQTMGAIAIDLEKVQQSLSNASPKVKGLLADSSELVEQATSELRTISYLLHPPMLDDFGLSDVLPWYAAGFSSRSGIDLRVDVQPHLGRLSQQIELALFRIVQETLTNIHRHSGSPTAHINLFHDAEWVTLEISDQGKGISHHRLTEKSNNGAGVGVGIAGMRERVRQLGGVLQIQSDDGGTSLTARLPIAAGQDTSEEG